MLLSRLLHRLIKKGRLNVIDAGGTLHRFGGTEASRAVTIKLHDPALHWRLGLRPHLYAGEAYMAGTLTIEDATIYDFLDLVARNLGMAETAPGMASVINRLDGMFRHIHQFNPMSRAKLNVAHHYDLSGRLYDLFLDDDRQYSCAYFPKGDEDLESAQELKKCHIAGKLHLEPGMRVLDIGSGWGGLGLYLAGECGCDVQGVTLSEEQLALSRSRAVQTGLADRVRFDLRDYREQNGPFDRIVSVGMFEHVGINHYREYFTKIRDLLSADGVALIHTIGRMSPPGITNPWIRKYIFPGGYIPALSETMAQIEKTGLWLTDVEVLRLHYAKTLRHWRERFEARREEAVVLYDERFCRMWEFYLAGSEVAFRHMGQVVFQLQLSRRQETLPLSRDYMTDWDRGMIKSGQPSPSSAAIH